MPRGKNPKSKKPKKQWYLTVGVSQIDGVSKLEPLPYATQDCQDIARLFEAGKVDLAVDEVFSLHDGDESALPTAANLKNCLKKISREAGEEDTVVVYLTCHGILDLQDEEKLYFCLRDTQEDETGKIDLSTAFSAQELVATLIESKTKNLILLIDSCHSGALKFPDISIEGTKNLYAILSCFPQQESFSYDILQGALMSHCLKKVLKGDFLKYIESNVSFSRRSLCCDSLYNSLKEKMETIEKRLYEHQRLSLSSLGQQQGIVTPQQKPLRKLGGQQTDNFTIAEVPNVSITNIEPRRALLVEIADSELETNLKAELKDKASFDNLQVWDGKELTKTIQAQLNVVSGTVLLYFRGKLLANNELQINQQIRLTASTLRQLLEKYQSAKQILLFDLNTEDEVLRRQWIKSIKLDSELGQCIITNDCSQQSNTLARDVASLLAKTSMAEGLAAADLIQQLKQGRKNREYFLSGKRDIIEVVLEPRESSIFSDIRFWRNYVHKYFPQEISSNFLTSFIDSRASFKTKEFYVPLGLLERKKIEKKKEIESSEQGSRLYEVETETIEVTQTFAGEEFYRDILLNRQGKTNGGRIAITGEPGGGKTTLSQDICGWLLRNTQIIPIWISLAQLGNGSLTEYLEQLWLSKFELDSRIDLEQLQDALKSQFLNGNVWLILDGVDEINSNDKIRRLRDYLQEGYIDYARVIVTSRLNTWETGHQLFDSFETYRTLPFTDLDIKEFIGRFFTDAAEKDKLTTQLEQNQRIKDLVRNPLRLMLLCSAWLQGKGTLPETQAKLYDWFVKHFYWFKQEQFPIFKKISSNIVHSRQLKKLIHKALGEISKSCLDRDNSSFLIDLNNLDDWLEEQLNVEYQGKTIREWILNLGWLNKVGVNADNEFQTVFTFFHATFQEYFAATVIDDWDYFVPREHTNFPVPNKTYRIFHNSWKQCILFWIGKESISSIDKEEFIDKLINFDDGINLSQDSSHKEHFKEKIYVIKALLLAGYCVLEFQSNYRNTILRWIKECLVEYSAYAYLNAKYISPRRYPINNTLLYDEIFKLVAIKTLSNSIEFENHNDLSFVIPIIADIGAGDERAARALCKVCSDNSISIGHRIDAIFSLKYVGVINEKVIITLINCILNAEHEDELIAATNTLICVCFINEQNTIFLFSVFFDLVHDKYNIRLTNSSIQTKEEKFFLYLYFILEHNYARHLKEKYDLKLRNNIDRTEEEKILCLLNRALRLDAWYDIGVRSELNRILSKINKNNIRNKLSYQFMGFLDSVIKSKTIVKKLSSPAINTLVNIEEANEQSIIDLLIIIISNTTIEEEIRLKAIELLRYVEEESKQAILALTNVIEDTSSNRLIRIEAIESLDRIGWKNENRQNIVNSISSILLNTTVEEDVRLKAIELLSWVGKGSKQATLTLTNAIEDASSNRLICIEALRSLAIIGVNNEQTIGTLINIVQHKFEDDWMRRQATEALGKVGRKNKLAISILIEISKSTHVDKETRRQAVESLGQIEIENELLIIEKVAKTFNILLKDISLDRFIKESTLESLEKIKRLRYAKLYQYNFNNISMSNFVDNDSFIENVGETIKTLKIGIKLICVDGNKFIDLQNPVLDIYKQMVKQGCPKIQNRPQTMSELSAYWELDVPQMENIPVLIFHEENTESNSSNFSTDFIDALSKFDGAICVISNATTPQNLKHFYPNQPNLVDNIIDWIQHNFLDQA